MPEGQDALLRRFSMAGQAALITGGSGGIGLASGRALAQAGAAVMLASEDASACRAAAATLRAEGLTAHAKVCDVRDSSALMALKDEVLATFGRLDALVYAAGVSPAPGPLAAVTEDTWRTIMTVNLEAAWQLSTLAAPAIAAQGGGSITFISSIAGLRGNSVLGAYGVSKAGLSQLARNLAVEWGPRGVRANSVAPGLIHTAFAAGMLAQPEVMARRLALTPLRRVGEPDEVAGLVLLLASAAGAFITGQTMVVDGGTLISDGS